MYSIHTTTYLTCLVSRCRLLPQFWHPISSKLAFDTERLLLQMPYNHQPICTKSRRQRRFAIRGRVYRASDRRPKSMSILTEDDGHRRFAFLQGIFSDDETQTRVWDCQVSVIDIYGLQHDFQFFFKNDRRLSENLAVDFVSPDAHWKGDVAMLRIATSSSRVVSMRSGDALLADFALHG